MACSFVLRSASIGTGCRGEEGRGVSWMQVDVSEPFSVSSVLSCRVYFWKMFTLERLRSIELPSHVKELDARCHT